MGIHNVFQFELAAGRTIITIAPSSWVADWSLVPDTSGMFVVESLQINGTELLAASMVIGHDMPAIGGESRIVRDDSAGKNWDAEVAMMKEVAANALRRGDRDGLCVGAIGMISMGSRPAEITRTVDRGASVTIGPNRPLMLTASADVATVVRFTFRGEALEGGNFRLIVNGCTKS